MKREGEGGEKVRGGEGGGGGEKVRGGDGVEERDGVS